MAIQIDGKPVVIFSDFDGTITQRDVIVMIMEAFAPPVWREITDQILNQRTLSIRDGVSKLFRLISGEKRAEIEAFVAQEVKLRPGFPEFLTFCQTHQIPFQVVSGGVDFFVEPVLAAYRTQLAIYCNGAEFFPDRIEVTMPYANPACGPCGQCGCCKLLIMDRFPAEQYYRIAIGDSLTDLAMARAADWTFARSKLIGYCEEESIQTSPYETFFDIQEALLNKREAPPCPL